MAADNYTPPPEDPLAGAPILLRPETFARHARAVEHVEQDNKARYPRVGRGRTTNSSSGQWGFLASGHTISAVSGMVLGTGIVTLCSRGGTNLAPDGDDVEVLNSGAAITGPMSLALGWTDGAWAACVCGTECVIHVIGCSGTEALVGATVTIKNGAGDTLDSGTTDESGDFVTASGCGSGRTVTVEATGYATHDFTGQTISSTTLNLNMAGHLDLTLYAICCGFCPFLKTVHYTWSSVHRVTGAHGGSGTATYRPANQDWPAALGSLVCFQGLPGLLIFYNTDEGTLSCVYRPTSFTCNPLNIVFGMPPEDECPDFSASTGITAFSMTMTA